MKTQSDINTPLGLVPRNLAPSVASHAGIRYNDGSWVILTYPVKAIKKEGKLTDGYLPIKFFNFEIALSKARMKLEHPTNSPEVFEEAMKSNYGTTNLAQAWKFSSYSKLIEHQNTQERNFFTLAKANK